MSPKTNSRAPKPGWRSNVLERLRERLFLERLQAQSAALTIAQRTRVRQYADSARNRLRAARWLRDGGTSSDALVVYWQGIALLARAYLTMRDAGFDESEFDLSMLLDRLQQELERQGHSLSKALSRNLAFAVDSAEQNDDLPPGEAALRAEDLDEIGRRLGDLIETRSPGQIKSQSRLRLAILATTVIAIPASLKIWFRVPTNVAVNKSVTASSTGEWTSPHGVVDQRLYGPFGFHSGWEDNPWVTIDLGKQYFITDAEVYGRHDCCLGDSVPITFQISQDGEAFRTVARKSDSFDSVEPWYIESISQRARFVRVRSEGKRYLVLSEVAVFGRSP